MLKTIVFMFYVVTSSSIFITLPHFWKSTGYSPNNPHQINLLSSDNLQNLILISSIPNNGIFFIRIHWLLDLITFKNGKFKFSQFDKFVENIHTLGFSMIFELMGNPSDIFNNFADISQQKLFMSLLEQILYRIKSKYGHNYISKWRFESWNEPDHKEYNTVNFDNISYLGYLDSCINGIRKYKSLVYFGGPAMSCNLPPKSSLCWSFFEHITNTLSEKNNIDFISIHKKGHNNSLATIIDSEKEFYDHIYQRYPTLSTLPIYNDEGDLVVGWWRARKWRATAKYASILIKGVYDHIQTYYNGPSNGSQPKARARLALLSNDNAFLNYHPYYFEQRTLFARFQMNESTSTHPANGKNHEPYSEFIKKPVYGAFCLLSYLGNTLLLQPQPRPLHDSPTTILHKFGAFRRKSDPYGGSRAHVEDMYRSNYYLIPTVYLASAITADGYNDVSGMAQISLLTGCIRKTGSRIGDGMVKRYQLSHLMTTMKVILDHEEVRSSMLGRYKIALAVFVVDMELTNPYQVWVGLGKPVFPNATQLKLMRRQEGFARVSLDLFSAGPTSLPETWMARSLSANFYGISCPGVVLYHFCVDRTLNRLIVPPESLRILPVTRAIFYISWAMKRREPLEASADTPPAFGSYEPNCVKTFELYVLLVRGVDKEVESDDDSNRPSWDVWQKLDTKGGDLYDYSFTFDFNDYRVILPTAFYLKIRAIDYWNRAGPFSEVVTWPK